MRQGHLLAVTIRLVFDEMYALLVLQLQVSSFAVSSTFCVFCLFVFNWSLIIELCSQLFFLIFLLCIGRKFEPCSSLNLAWWIWLLWNKEREFVHFNLHHNGIKMINDYELYTRGQSIAYITQRWPEGVLLICCQFWWLREAIHFSFSLLNKNTHVCSLLS